MRKLQYSSFRVRGMYELYNIMERKDQGNDLIYLLDEKYFEEKTSIIQDQYYNWAKQMINLEEQ